METLKLHARGSAVKTLQILLNESGYQLMVDGIFGKGTEKAVKDFQQKAALTVDGVVGPATWEALRQPEKNTFPKLLKEGMEGNLVKQLQELLNQQGFSLLTDGIFGPGTVAAVKKFQRDRQLVVDGIVGNSTWEALLEDSDSVHTLKDTALKAADIEAFAQTHELEIAVVQAVRDVESNGNGFLSNGLPVILFEGHIFWRQLEKRGYNPASMVPGYEDVLYRYWTRKYYQGGIGEWNRLRKAATIRSDIKVSEAAYCSASYGLFQIMGFHYELLGYATVMEFVADMKKDEATQLKAFGEFLSANQLLTYLRNHQWTAFARRYNGPGYKQNQYDTKLAAAYRKYTA